MPKKVVKKVKKVEEPKEEPKEEVAEELVVEETVTEPKDEVITIQVCGMKVTGLVGVDANGNKTVTTPEGVTYHA